MPESSYPIVLTKLAGARCVVVGGGSVAERKVSGLIEAGARPLVISPRLTPALRSWLDAGQIEHHPRPYQEDDLSGAILAIAATDDPAVNARVAADARSRGILANIADDPEASSFHNVGTVRRGDLLLTISTGAASPALAAQLRAKLAEQFGPEYGRALALAAAIRTLPPEALPATERAALVSWLCSEQALGRLRNDDDDLVAARVQAALAPGQVEVAA